MSSCSSLRPSARVPARVIPRGMRGFTMTELAVAVAIAAILSVIAVPSFQGTIASQRAKTFSSALYGTLAKARSDAITLNNNVTVQPKAGGWQTGWQILDVNNNVLDDYTAATGLTVQAIAPAAVTYRSSGRLAAGAAAPQFQISAGSGSTVSYQCVAVDVGGRPYMVEAQTCP